MSTYLVVGASRGIGLELVNQLGSNPDNTVIVTVRNADKLESVNKFGYTNIKAIFVDMDDSLEKFEAAFKPLAAMVPQGIDVVIHNAGIMGQEAFKPIDQQDLEYYNSLYQVNTLGPVKTYRMLLPILSSQAKKFKYAIISSRGGSIGGMKNLTTAYGMSKAAVNHFSRQLAIKHEPEENIVIALHPGVVETDLSAFATGFTLIKPEESASKMLSVIDKLTLQDSGKFWSYDGTILPW